MKMKFKYSIFYLSLFFIIGFFLVSCGNKGKNLSIESFEYEVSENESSVANELSYILSFEIEFSFSKNTSINDFKVEIHGLKSFQMTMDDCNTENVILSKNSEEYPYAILNYTVPSETTSMNAIVKIKISTSDLMDDINRFLKISIYNQENYKIIDKHNLLNNGSFKMNYSSNTGIYYEYNEFSESYKVVSVITKLKSLELPSIYNHHPVKEIAVNAFDAVTDIEELILPTTLTSMPRGLLGGMMKLKSLSIPFVGEKLDGTGATHFGYIFGASEISGNSNYVPSSLKQVIVTGGESIEKYAFENCSHLESITLSNSILYVDKKAFSGCSLEKASVPAIAISCLPKDTIKEVIITGGEQIEDSAFSNCISLESVTIPNCVTSIGRYAFENCSSLETITIPEGVENIEDFAFSECGNLANIALSESVTSIGHCAFYGCIELKSIVIPNSVIDIVDTAFHGCTNLETAYLPTTAICSIPDTIKEVILTSGYEIGRYALQNYINLKNIIIPNSVIDIGEYAFSGCNNIEKATLPAIAIPYIPTENLKEVIITEGESIESYTFQNCHSLENVTIPEGVTIIKSDAFSNCSNLTSITLPNSVEIIERDAIIWCDNLQYNEYDNGYYLGNETNPYLCLIKSVDTSITTCKISEKTKHIYDSAFTHCSNLTSISLPDSIISIGASAFYYCTNLKSIELSNHITTIEDSTFSRCSSLESITIPNGVTRIKYNSFSNCSSLTSITFPDSIEIIDKFAFNNCKNLKSITIPDHITTIKDSTFYGCSNLESIILPEGIISIEEYAFKNCNSLKEVYYMGTASTWENIKIYFSNDVLYSSTIYFYSEKKPTISGNYWHYVDGRIIKW